jgi:hypothetical protein
VLGGGSVTSLGGVPTRVAGFSRGSPGGSSARTIGGSERGLGVEELAPPLEGTSVRERMLSIAPGPATAEQLLEISGMSLGTSTDDPESPVRSSMITSSSRVGDGRVDTCDAPWPWKGNILRVTGAGALRGGDAICVQISKVLDVMDGLIRTVSPSQEPPRLQDSSVVTEHP